MTLCCCHDLVNFPRHNADNFGAQKFRNLLALEARTQICPFLVEEFQKRTTFQNCAQVARGVRTPSESIKNWPNLGYVTWFCPNWPTLTEKSESDPELSTFLRIFQEKDFPNSARLANFCKLSLYSLIRSLTFLDANNDPDMFGWMTLGLQFVQQTQRLSFSFLSTKRNLANSIELPHHTFNDWAPQGHQVSDATSAQRFSGSSSWSCLHPTSRIVVLTAWGPFSACSTSWFATSAVPPSRSSFASSRI